VPINSGNIEISVEPVVSKLLAQKGISLSIARFDKCHPVISGNKIFKLQPFIDEAISRKCDHLVSFGGAFSNHLLAMSFACKEYGISSTGIIRGDDGAGLNQTLQQCQQYGMRLEFVSREQYADLKSIQSNQWIQEKFGEHVMIPEGGYHPTGATGAMAMYKSLTSHSFSDIAIPVGTGTTLAGFLMADRGRHRILGISCLKGLRDTSERMKFLTGEERHDNLSLIQDYHFGGFAKYDSSLIDFINEFHESTGIETDFVYTGKMLFAIMDMIRHDRFSEGSKIVCIHTGGLQGNHSISNLLSFPVK
jgi:1-aminocyclopropane-1-carboxylate deaminase/D-cysteine desulfhydrase-like pyridoxal-dependent ACC family enzyme